MLDTEAVRPTPVRHKGQKYAGLAVVHDPELNTSRYRSAKGLRLEGATACVPLMHGTGPLTSHAGSMLAILNTLTASKRKPGRSKSLKRLRAMQDYTVLSSEAVDLPGSHGRPIPAGLDELPRYAEWVARWFADLRAATGLPVIPLARSASATVTAEVARCHPGLIDGIILLSPMLPTASEHSNADLLRRVSAGDCELNRAGFDFMNRINAQSDWDQRGDPFAGLPTLIFTGELDTQASDPARDRCRGWADRLPNVRYHDVEDAGHDVLNLRDREPGLVAYGDLYGFVASVVG